MAAERAVAVGDDRVIRVRQVGDISGPAVVYFHGTPGSRLDLVFGDDIVERLGVHLVTFDRPGYGNSSPIRFGLSDVARDVVAVADVLGIERFATLGMSGGGGFALATAAVAPARVTAVGVAGGAGPFQHVPGALDSLSAGDTAAAELLPDDPEAAAAGFAAGFTELASILASGSDEAVLDYFAPALSDSDRRIFHDPVVGPSILASLRNGMSAGNVGAGWDNVAWIGEWDFDLASVGCPVVLWYGSEDAFGPSAHGEYQRDHLPNGQLVIRDGEGHFGPLWLHLDEVLGELTSS